jgi:hypothetical protein
MKEKCLCGHEKRDHSSDLKRCLVESATEPCECDGFYDERDDPTRP